MRSSDARFFPFVLLSLALLSVAASTVAGQGAAPSAAAPTTQVIALANTAFDPQITIVLVNQTVSWQNKDSFNHDVTSDDHLFNSTGGAGQMKPGDKYEHVFTKAGVYDYHCTLHSTGRGNNMWGRLIVTEAPALQVAGGPGAGVNPSKVGVHWLAHWVGIISFIAVFVTLVIYYFVLKYGETVHATDHRDRKEK